MQEIIFKEGNYYAKILADSVAQLPLAYRRDTVQPARLVTMEVCCPRFILAEFNTHRDKSRNSASSRAIPVPTRIKQIDDDPVVPEAFGKNKSGMQSSETLDSIADAQARAIWTRVARQCVQGAKDLAEIEVHKQHANRVMETFAWHTIVVSGTRWQNMMNLRTHKDAQPEMIKTAKLMRQALAASKPSLLREGEWHLPYVTEAEHAAYAQDPLLPIMDLVAASIVRCAAVSFERQYADRTATQIGERFRKMLKQGHWSPFEHAAKVANVDEIDRYALFRRGGQPHGGLLNMPYFTPVSIGNFDVPWLQFRKTQPGEDVWTPTED